MPLIPLDLPLSNTVLIHSNLTGLVKNQKKGWGRTAQMLLDGLCNKTIVAPTFTYSFCKGVPFSPEESLGEVGLLGNYLLTRPGSIRSHHPIFSFTALGPHAQCLCNTVSFSAFGRDSVFDRLHRENATLLFLDTPFQACTFVHYIEQRVGVPYRYSKSFHGEILFKGKSTPISCEYYVRRLEQGVETHLATLEERLKEAGVIRSFIKEGILWQTISAQDLVHYTEKWLRDDPLLLLANKTYTGGSYSSDHRHDAHQK